MFGSFQLASRLLQTLVQRVFHLRIQKRLRVVCWTVVQPGSTARPFSYRYPNQTENPRTMTGYVGSLVVGGGELERPIRNLLRYLESGHRPVVTSWNHLRWISLSPMLMIPCGKMRIADGVCMTDVGMLRTFWECVVVVITDQGGGILMSSSRLK